MSTRDELEALAERLRQIAESQRMDFDSPHVAMTLDEAADAVLAKYPAQVAISYCPIHGDLLAAPRSYRCANATVGHEFVANSPAQVVTAEDVRDHMDAYEDLDGQCVSVDVLLAAGVNIAARLAEGSGS